MIKILLVEDNEMNRDMLSLRLERKGYQVVMALDAEQSVAIAAFAAPALQQHSGQHGDVMGGGDIAGGFRRGPATHPLGWAAVADVDGRILRRQNFLSPTRSAPSLSRAAHASESDHRLQRTAPGTGGGTGTPDAHCRPAKDP